MPRLDSRLWSPPSNQPPTEFRLELRNGTCSVWLTTKWQASDPEFHAHVQRSTNKNISCVGVASGEDGAGQYPAGVRVIHAPMYHRGRLRTQGVQELYEACELAAVCGEAVVVHCNQSFHRGPILLAGVAKLGGAEKNAILEELADERDIYPGHTMDPEDWEDHDPDLKRPRLAASSKEVQRQIRNIQANKSLKDAHNFVDNLRPHRGPVLQPPWRQVTLRSRADVSACSQRHRSTLACSQRHDGGLQPAASVQAERLRQRDWLAAEDTDGDGSAVRRRAAGAWTACRSHQSAGCLILPSHAYQSKIIDRDYGPEQKKLRDEQRRGEQRLAQRGAFVGGSGDATQACACGEGRSAGSENWHAVIHDAPTSPSQMSELAHVTARQIRVGVCARILRKGLSVAELPEFGYLLAEPGDELFVLYVGDCNNEAEADWVYAQSITWQKTQLRGWIHSSVLEFGGMLACVREEVTAPSGVCDLSASFADILEILGENGSCVYARRLDVEGSNLVGCASTNVGWMSMQHLQFFS